MEVVVIGDGGRCVVRDSRKTVEAVGSKEIAVIGSHRYSAQVETVIVAGGDAYKGAYEVTPRVSSQTLPTALKTMRKDVTIYGVPRYDVSNEYGTTVSIAMEV